MRVLTINRGRECLYELFAEKNPTELAPLLKDGGGGGEECAEHEDELPKMEYRGMCMRVCVVTPMRQNKEENIRHGHRPTRGNGGKEGMIT